LITAKDPVTYLSEKVKASELMLQKDFDVLYNLNKQQSSLRLMGSRSKNDLNELSNQIDSINMKNKIKREFYLVTIPLNGSSAPRFHYS